MDQVQVSRYFWTYVSVFYTWNDMFYQQRDGLLEGDRFARTARMIEVHLQQPGTRLMWKQIRFSFGTEFQSLMDEIMNRTRVTVPPDINALWKAGIEAELSQASA